MDQLRKLRNYVVSFFVPPKIVVDITEVGVIDVYLEKTLQILYWQSTERTLKVFFLLNTLFWVVLMLNIKFYGVLSLIGLIVFVYDVMWRDTLFAEYKGEYSAIIKELRSAFYEGFHSFGGLRKASPVVFYSSLGLFFLTLHMVSKQAPGEFLFYLLFLSVFFLPVGFQLLPQPVTSRIKKTLQTLRTPMCTLAEDELIPFIQGKDFSKKDADMESLLTDRTADSVTNSLVSGITSMPSYLEVAGSPTDDIQEEDLLPQTGAPNLSFTPGELSSDSDSENRDIRFDSDHFNTSSSEDDPYSKDLKFPKKIEVKQPGTSENVGMFQSMMNTVGSNIVANMFQSAIYSRTPVVPSRKDSDSDFEIVDASEITGDSENDG